MAENSYRYDEYKRKPKKIGGDSEENQKCTNCHGLLFHSTPSDGNYEFCRSCRKKRTKRTK